VWQLLIVFTFYRLVFYLCSVRFCLQLQSDSCLLKKHLIWLSDVIQSVVSVSTQPGLLTTDSTPSLVNSLLCLQDLQQGITFQTGSYTSLMMHVSENVWTHLHFMSLLRQIARTSLNSWVHLTGQFKFNQREKHCKNTKPYTLKSRWAHSDVQWRNQPLKSPLSWVTGDLSRVLAVCP